MVTPESSSRSTLPHLGIALQIALTIAAIFLLAHFTAWADIARTLDALSFALLVGSFAVYLVITLLRAGRFWILGARTERFSELVAIVWVHNLAGYLLPLRLGELAFPLLARSRTHLRAGAGGAAVVVARLSDGVGFLLLLAVCLAFSESPLPVHGAWVGAALIAVCGAVLLLPRISRRLTAGQRDASAASWRRLLLDAGDLFAEAHYWRLVPFALGIFGLGALINWWVMDALGIGLNFFTMTVALSLSTVASLLPIQPVGGWGVFEGTVVMGLALYGIDAQTALTAGLVLHVVNYVLFLPLGLLGALRLWGSR